jgi:hypothetical protein
MAGLAVTSRSGLGFAEYLKEQGKRLGERMWERERCGREKKKIKEETCGGEGERKKVYIYFLKLK